mgnify:CR=1 FL=1
MLLQEILLSLFARWGLPKQVVTDNGPQLTSDELRSFMKRNGVKHIFTSPFHPATNGAAERSVGVLKNSIKASTGKFNLHNFLMANRSTMQATTGRSPAELMLGHPLRTRLDLLKPNLDDMVHGQQDRMIRNSGKIYRNFIEGQKVLVRDYRARDKW